MRRKLVALFMLLISAALGKDDDDLPLAPYNVKLYCRTGLSNTTDPVECPSSSTSCGFIELALNVADRKIGIYECVDAGIIVKESDEYDENNSKQTLFDTVCGAIPHCATLSLKTLNANFISYITATYNVDIDEVDDGSIKFCCALYHSTLNRLVSSGKEVLPLPAVPPVKCGDKECDAGAIGCLLHSRYGAKAEPPRNSNSKKQSLNSAKAEYSEEYVEEYEVDEDDLVLPPPTKQRRPRLKKRKATQVDYDNIQPVEISFGEDDDSYLKGMEVIDYSGEDDNAFMRRGSAGPRSTSRPYVSMEDEYDDDSLDEGVHSCVYRHLNDERYRFCLLIHSEKDGDRCYEHRGHSICCCFVSPYQTTCDPTDLDLVIPAGPRTHKPKPSPTAIPQTTAIIPKDSHFTTQTSETQIDAPILEPTTTTTTSTTMTTTTLTSTPKRRKFQHPTRGSNIAQGCRLVYSGMQRADGTIRTPRVECSAAPMLASYSVIPVLVLALAYAQ